MGFTYVPPPNAKIIRGGAFSDVQKQEEKEAPRKYLPNPNPVPQHIKEKSTRERLLKFVNLKI